MIFIVLVLFFLTVSPLYGQVLFETNFDNTETWQPRNGANDTAPDGSQITPCDVGVSGCPSPPPGGWDYYYIMKVVRTDSTFALYLNGTHITPDITDSTYPSGQYIGLSFDVCNGAYAPADDFEGGQ